MSEKPTVSTVTTVVETKKVAEGKYEISEIKSDEFTPPDLHSGNRKQLDIPLPVPGLGVSAYYDVDDKSIGAYVTFLGSILGGKMEAGLSGLDLGVNLALVKGNIRIFGENNKIKVSFRLELWKPFTDNEVFESTIEVLDI